MRSNATPLLEFRDDEVDELLEAPRRISRREHEAVCAALVHEIFKLIGDIRLRADEPGHSHAFGVNQRRLSYSDGRAAFSVDDGIEQSLNAGDFDVLNVFVQIVFREVGPKMTGYPRDRAFKRNAFADALVFLVRFAAGQTDDRLHAIDALNVIAASIEASLQAAVEIIGIFAHAGDVRMNGENGLGVLGGKVAPAIRRPRLPKHRHALRRTEYEGASATTDILDDMINVMHLGRICE